jgi:mono/diheme cytochrome c family protein
MVGVGWCQTPAQRSLHHYLKGRHIYQSQCLPCHGATGRGDGPWSEGLKDKPRNFRTGIFKFQSTPAGSLPTMDDLRRTIRHGVTGTAMPAFTKLTDDDVTSVIVYVQGLSRRWQDPEQQGKPLPVPDLPDWWGGDSSLSKEKVAEGKTLFTQTCVACHGKAGKGDGVAGKTLIDAWENPIQPADLTQPHHKSGDSPQDLYRTIAIGLGGTPMIGFREAFKPDQIWSLVAFIRSLEQGE